MAPWRIFAVDGRYSEALSAAEAAGFGAECQRASAADLMLLGNAARFAGSPSRARQAYSALRRRFPNDPRASLSAFDLARVAFDQMADYGQAVAWFETYLREQPAGPLAQEASGRLMESLQRSGNQAAARRIAERYLVQYPGGPHADFARRLMR